MIRLPADPVRPKTGLLRIGESGQPQLPAGETHPLNVFVNGHAFARPFFGTDLPGSF